MSAEYENHGRGHIITWVVLAVITGGSCWLAIFRGEEIQRATLVLLEGVQRLGPWGPVLLIASVTLSMLLVLPGFPFTLAAGFLFGVVKGTLCIFVGTVAGGSLAFFAGRYLFKERLTTSLQRWPKIHRFIGVIAQEEWRFVMFTRMVPMFPYKLSNYAFGATSISYTQFFLGMCIGIVPLAATNVYAGSLLSSLSTIGAEEGPGASRHWGLYGGGFAVAVAFTVYVAYLARKSIEPFEVDHPDTSGPEAPS